MTEPSSEELYSGPRVVPEAAQPQRSLDTVARRIVHLTLSGLRRDGRHVQLAYIVVRSMRREFKKQLRGR